MATAARAPRILQWADRWLHILRYHRPEQLARRLWNRVGAPWLDGVAGTTPVTPWHSRSWSILRENPPPRFAVWPHLDPDETRRGVVTLLNRPWDLGQPLDWRIERHSDMPLLAAFHLHYHEFLASLVEQNAHQASWAWNLIQHWIDEFPPVRRTRFWRRVAWHPYCISRRLPVWLRLRLVAPPDPKIDERIRQSIANQASWLASHFERDLGGNHLWENAKTLTLVGAAFDGPQAEAWREQGLSVLQRCIADQILESGEHIERSPMYQAALVAGLRDLAPWLATFNPVAAQSLTATAERMQRHLDGIRHPDSGVPLFSDSTLDDDHAVLPASATNETTQRLTDNLSNAS